MKKILHGHVSPETAFVVEDYPYGFRLRCRQRHWLETKAGHGVRHVTQTTNPKQSGHPWNKPKAGTYSRGLYFLYQDDANDHVNCTGIGSGSLPEDMVPFFARWQDQFTAEQHHARVKLLAYSHHSCPAYWARWDSGRITWLWDEQGVKAFPVPGGWLVAVEHTEDQWTAEPGILADQAAAVNRAAELAYARRGDRWPSMRAVGPSVTWSRPVKFTRAAYFALPEAERWDIDGVPWAVTAVDGTGFGRQDETLCPVTFLDEAPAADGATIAPLDPKASLLEQTKGRTIWDSDGTDGPVLICPPPGAQAPSPLGIPPSGGPAPRAWARPAWLARKAAA